jgi:hypothetical protein
MAMPSSSHCPKQQPSTPKHPGRVFDVELPSYVQEVIDVLNRIDDDAWISANSLRHTLNRGKWWFQQWWGTKFYTMMNNLVAAGLVLATDHPRTVNGVQIMTRWYHKRM